MQLKNFINNILGQGTPGDGQITPGGALSTPGVDCPNISQNVKEGYLVNIFIKGYDVSIIKKRWCFNEE